VCRYSIRQGRRVPTGLGRRAQLGRSERPAWLQHRRDRRAPVPPPVQRRDLPAPARDAAANTKMMDDATPQEKTEGALIVLTAPLTETIDHAGYFIQMSMASLPMWLEGILNRKYPKWREVEYNADGTARYMPAGVRVLEKSLLRAFSEDDIAACYPDDLHQILGPKKPVVAISPPKPLGVTFPAGR